MVFGWWRRKGQGRAFQGREGFACQFPDKPSRTQNQYQRPEGLLETIVYRVIDDKQTFSVTVRQGSALRGLSNSQSIQAWLAEFQETMSSAGHNVELVDERPLLGRADARAMVFRAGNGATTLRFALVPQAEKLFVCSAIGPSARDGSLQQFVESFSVS